MSIPINGAGEWWQAGRCGYCGLHAEDYDHNHVQNCRKRHLKYVESKDKTKLLERIALALEDKR